MRSGSPILCATVQRTSADSFGHSRLSSTCTRQIRTVFARITPRACRPGGVHGGSPIRCATA
ncbi:response regulator [Burkholderia sp. ABCPW 111]|nr:response regulator [Burkholderia sp. ABCPW 111]